MSRIHLFTVLAAATSLGACALPVAVDNALPPATAPTATQKPTSAVLPPVAPNLVTPPNPLSTQAAPSPFSSPLPSAPPEVVAPAGADATAMPPI